MHLAPKVMQTKLRNGLYDLVTTWRRHLELNMYWNDAMVELQYLAIQHLGGAYYVADLGMYKQNLILKIKNWKWNDICKPGFDRFN